MKPMLNPIEYTVKMQKAAIHSTFNTLQMLSENYLRFLEHQNMAVGTVMGRRAEDASKHAKVKPGGPDLKDHYGNRLHDIDVEHDL